MALVPRRNIQEEWALVERLAGHLINPTVVSVAAYVYQRVHWSDLAWYLVKAGFRRGSEEFRNMMKRYWDERSRAEKKRSYSDSEIESKSYEPPKKKKKDFKDSVSMAGSSKRGRSGAPSTRRSNKRRKTTGKRRMSLWKNRGLNKKQKGIVRKMVKKSAKRIVANNKNSVFRNFRLMNTGAVSEDSYNVANYQAFTIATKTSLENYMQYGYYQMVSAGTDGDQSALKRVRLEYESTYRPKTNMQGKHHGYVSYTFKNNDLIGIEMRFYEYVCNDNGGGSVIAFFDGAVDVAHNETGINRDSPLLYPTQFESSYAKYWRRVKKVRTVILNPGEEVIYTMKYPRKWHNPGAHVTMGGNTEYIQDLTKTLLVRTVGAICHDVEDNLKVGYSKHQYDYIEKYYVKFEFQHNPSRHDKMIETLDDIKSGEVTGMDVAEENPIP